MQNLAIFQALGELPEANEMDRSKVVYLISSEIDENSGLLVFRQSVFRINLNGALEHHQRVIKALRSSEYLQSKKE